MQLLLSCAKTMTERSSVPTPRTTRPAYRSEASELAAGLATLPTDELARLLRVNRPYRRRKPPALRPLPRRRRRGDPSPYGLHGNRLQTHRPGEFHRRRFRIRPTAPQHHLVPLRTAPPAGRHPHLPARRRRRTARPRRRNDVFLLAKPADRRPAGPDSRRRRHPGQPGERRDEAAVRLETRLPRSAGSSRPNSASARATG